MSHTVMGDEEWVMKTFRPLLITHHPSLHFASGSSGLGTLT
jgi:hypothetical protein